MIKIREWLKKLREDNRMTQQSVAEQLNISTQYYQMIEAHERQKNMDITLATKLSVLFNISLSSITKYEQELSEKIKKSESLVR